ncbi:hypothetical protein [Cytobacillus firmus]|uniref:Uncharacterized protein n=1 Tax=Cytobacillus firmus DS1 TaxID=1307436 RepID=W7KZ57_CYTFI|nr:hypothetical protein [Cytobacillus firmus]EWG11378.1 hypothetical protein PBF_10147 [Cytobacillus firmus DS1]
MNKDNVQAVKQIAEDLLNEEKSHDLSSIFKIANQLLRDESFIGLVEEIGKNSEGIPEAPTEGGSAETGGDTEKELAGIKREVQALKSELNKMNKIVADLQKQNESLLGMYLKVIKAANKDFKKSIDIISAFGKLNK